MTRNNEPAFQVGVNLGGWISQYPSFDRRHFDTFITQADIRQIAGWGMDHIRLPVDYPVLQADTEPSGYREEGWAYVDRCLEWCQANGLGAVLDLHKAPGFSFDRPASATLFHDGALQDRFVALWQAAARRYRKIGDPLAFEMLNEIVLPTSDPWNQLARRAIAAIRAVDPDRLIVLRGNNYNSAAALADLDLPDDRRVLCTFHFYEPLLFTHQKAYWMPELVEYDQTIEYPGESPGLKEFLAKHPREKASHVFAVGPNVDRELVLKAVQPALDYRERTSRPLYCGEYGVIDRAPMASRLRWYRDCVGILREAGIGRAVWSYKQMDFGLVDANGQVVNAELVKIVGERQTARRGRRALPPTEHEGSPGGPIDGA